MLDETDRRIVEILMRDARTSLKALAHRVGLSSPSVSERLRRLEHRGVIEAFTIRVNAEALGYGIEAIVRIRPLPAMLHVVERAIHEIPEFVECDQVTGEDCFVGRLQVRSMAQLEAILAGLSQRAQTNTAIVKATPVKRRLPPF
ncbi:MAG: Lrp/AsnC family transcriptional regulator [Lysobacter sp.]